MRKKGVELELPDLSAEELKRYEGLCVGIVDGKAVFAHKDAKRVLDKLAKYDSQDKVFTSIPRGNVTLVK